MMIENSPSLQSFKANQRNNAYETQDGSVVKGDANEFFVCPDTTPSCVRRAAIDAHRLHLKSNSRASRVNQSSVSVSQSLSSLASDVHMTAGACDHATPENENFRQFSKLERWVRQKVSHSDHNYCSDHQ